MKILIVGQYFYPDNFRINDISFSLANRGHDVTVLTGLPDYSTGRIPDEYKKRSKRMDTINNVKIIRVPIIARRKGIIWRSVNYISFLINSTFRILSLKKDNYDVIFCYQTSPVMMANAAVEMKKRSGKKLFLYCMDLWPESLKAWGVAESSMLYKIMRTYSSRIYQSCDVVGISSLPFNDYLVDINGVEKEKIIYLPQHAEDINEVLRDSVMEPSKNINFAFAGNIGKVQDVECIIRAVSHLRDLKGFAVHIFGNGSMLQPCKDLAKELDVLENIQFHGRINKEQLLEEYRKIDVFLLTLKPEGFIGLTMPSKLQEYMSAGKPIIAAIGGAAVEVIKESRCGLVSPASDDISLAENMRAMINHPEMFRDYGQNAYKYYKENFTKEVFLAKLEEILKGIA